MDLHESLITLILAIVDEVDEVEKSSQAFKNCFLHSHLKKVYPSMKYYQDKNIDFTLLLLENMTSNEEIYDYINEIMKEEILLNDRLDKILKKIFNLTTYELRYSLGAIRSGKKELDFSIVAKEGF